MPNYVTPTEIFIRKAKKLINKYSTLRQSIFDLEEQLILNPYMGVSYGASIYKVRVADESKGKGKSGGFRVITYLVKESNDTVEIMLITIFDKAEQDSISPKDVKKYVKEVLSSRKK